MWHSWLWNSFFFFVLFFLVTNFYSNLLTDLWRFHNWGPINEAGKVQFCLRATEQCPAASSDDNVWWGCRTLQSFVTTRACQTLINPDVTIINSEMLPTTVASVCWFNRSRAAADVMVLVVQVWFFQFVKWFFFPPVIMPQTEHESLSL